MLYFKIDLLLGISIITILKICCSITVQSMITISAILQKYDNQKVA